MLSTPNFLVTKPHFQRQKVTAVETRWSNFGSNVVSGLIQFDPKMGITSAQSTLLNYPVTGTGNLDCGTLVTLEPLVVPQFGIAKLVESLACRFTGLHDDFDYTHRWIGWVYKPPV